MKKAKKGNKGGFGEYTPDGIAKKNLKTSEKSKQSNLLKMNQKTVDVADA